MAGIGGLLGMGGGFTGGSASASSQSGEASGTLDNTINAANRTLGGFHVNFGGQQSNGTPSTSNQLLWWAVAGVAGLVAWKLLRR